VYHLTLSETPSDTRRAKISHSSSLRRRHKTVRDLNPVDFMFGALQQRVYCDDNLKPWNMEQIKQAITDEWRALSQKFIDRSIY